MFENIRQSVNDIFRFGNEFVIRKNISPEDIETCEGVATGDKRTRTCKLCVALNHTVFRNVNRPEYVHPSCKCEYG